MKTKISMMALAAILATSFSSCKKDTQGNSEPSSLSFRMQAVNRTVSLPVQANGMKSGDTTSASVVWDSAFMLVSKVKFEAEMKSANGHKDSLEISYSWRGPQTINMFDLTSTVGAVTLPAGTYEKISLTVNSEREDANGQPLFYLSGDYTNAAGITLPIVISVSDPISFKTVQKGDTIIAGGITDFTSTIQVYLDQLLLQVDLTALDNATLTNGVLLISATSNKELYELILHNLKKDHHCGFEHHHRH